LGDFFNTRPEPAILARKSRIELRRGQLLAEEANLSRLDKLG
jgi:hypothetical protein